MCRHAPQLCASRRSVTLRGATHQPPTFPAYRDTPPGLDTLGNSTLRGATLRTSHEVLK